MTTVAERLELWPIDRLIPYARNARTHSPEQISQIAGSIAEFGFTAPILAGSDGVIVAGHGRLAAARRLGMDTVPVIVLDHLTPSQRRALIIADNRLALNAGWDEELLRVELSDLDRDGFDLDVLGFDDDELRRLLDESTAGGGSGAPEAGSVTLADRFLIPPFSVLSPHEGWWMERKRAWIGLGIRSELGRGESAVISRGDSAPEALQSPRQSVPRDRVQVDAEMPAA